MNLKQQLEHDLKDAMRANDAVRKGTLRMALAAIKEAEVLKHGELDDAALLALAQKQVKVRQEAIAEAEEAKRPDLVEEALAEIAVLEAYLPKALDPAELEKLVDEAIAEAGATSPADMGNVMKIVLPKVQGRADGGQVSQLVRTKLQS